MLKDYDCVRKYHPGNANVVVDAWSRKFMSDLRAMSAQLSVTNDRGLLESYNSFTMHPSNSKMYCDLRKLYWWTRLKRPVFEYVVRCLVC
ncbi:ty3-gypsy retrotransposon protein [Gossypium australe]|uniref:Ty3-gypsy retrotransposon protein n=1 Tax=Gossypium australe TaxID=47621 RepID=A0A5B6WNH1_9ROSI|nr:ty3-gypsy retrotransposon protein [Gossypium australe]